MKDQQPESIDRALNTLRGYYMPSFLQMMVDTPESLGDLNKLKDKDYSTFFHEYIHYLQDMTTTFGVVNANIVGNRFKHYVKEVETSAQNNFNIPISIPAGNIESLNRELQQVYLGNSTLGKMDVSKVSINLVKFIGSNVILPPPYSKYLEEVNVYLTYNGVAHDYKLGAIGLMETMANLIQTKYYPSVVAPAFPYHSGKLVAQYVYPAIGNNDEFVFTLCDACLMEYHPGRAFLHMLELMKSQNYVPKNSAEIYDYVDQNIKGPSGESLYDIFEMRSKDAEDLYADIFASPVFFNEKDWMKAVLETGRDLRINDPTFMLKLYQEPSSKNATFASLIDRMGTPLMFNRNENANFHAPVTFRNINIQPDRMAAILEMFRLFDEGRKTCGLSSFCSLHITTDARCTSTPWLRVTDAQLCSYAQFWKTWNLAGKSPY